MRRQFPNGDLLPFHIVHCIFPGGDIPGHPRHSRPQFRNILADGVVEGVLAGRDQEEKHRPEFRRTPDPEDCVFVDRAYTRGCVVCRG